MKLSTWARFVRDYFLGLDRWVRKRTPSSSLPCQKDAVRRYFAGINFQKYLKYHTSMNSELFIRYVFSELKARVRAGDLIVDIGAGFCDLESAMALKLPECTKFIAVDIHSHMLLAGRKRLENGMGHNASVLYLAADAENCALTDSCADFAVCINVTPYLEALGSLAWEVERVLKKGGTLILIQPQRNFYWEKEFEGVKLNFFDLDHTKEMIEGHGFVTLEKKELRFYFVPFLKPLSTVYASMYVFRKVYIGQKDFEHLRQKPVA